VQLLIKEKQVRKVILNLLVIMSLLIPSVALADKAIVVLYESGCHSYFIADGPMGYYLMEWYGGYDPSKGDIIVGDISSYGFKDVYYPQKDREGRIYIDDYMLSKDRVLEKYYKKCK
jgi:hypothetical protein